MNTYGISEEPVSILVFLDVALRRLMSYRLVKTMQCFNPCFLGCCSETRTSPAGSTPGIRGFNPCFLGCCSETSILFNLLTQFIKGFNPCFLGCCSETVRASSEMSGAGTSFNPCFLGCCSETQRDHADEHHDRDVSILVFLDVALRHGGRSACSSGEGWFQSLFSWMLL